MMIGFICPICREYLKLTEKSYICCNNHCFDLSKYGYVNLMRSQKSSKKRHGDDKLMLNSRHAFLDKEFYKPLLDELCAILLKISNGKNISVLDAGCGEGYYTANIRKTLPCSEFYGIDISKDALIFAAKRDKMLRLAVSSCAKLPFDDKSFNIVLNIFSPTVSEEYSRVLKDTGFLIKAIPLERHLFGLKRSIYANPYENKPEDKNLTGFTLSDYKEIKYSLTLQNNEDIMNLFKMTPYYYKTSREDQAKIEDLNYLETEIEFGICVYAKGLI